MPTMSRRLKNAVNLALFFGIALSALGQQKINPATQINWPASCTAATPLYNISTGVCVASTGQIVFTGPWSAFTTYGINEAVSFSGSQYVSIQNGNLNQDPATQTTYWALLFGGGSGMTQITGDIAAGPGTGSQVATLPNINGNVGTCGDATHVGQVTLNAKGQTTGCTPVSIAAGSNGFPITIGSTPLAASSTTTTVASLALTTSTINGVTPSTSAGSTKVLHGDGSYSAVPIGSSVTNFGPMYMFGESTCAYNYNSGVGALTESNATFGLLSRDFPGQTYNFCFGGTFMSQVEVNILQQTPPYTAQTGPALGIITEGINNYSVIPSLTQNYTYEMNAGAAWIAMPAANRIFASQATASSGWGAANPFLLAPGWTGTDLQSSTNGNTLSFSVPSGGTVIGINWAPSNSSAGTFTVAVDGTPVNNTCTGTTTWNNFGCAGSLNPTTVALFRQELTVSGASHTILITVTSSTGGGNFVDIMHVDRSPASRTLTNPVTIISGVPKQLADADPIDSATYNGLNQAVATALTAENLNVYFAEVRTGANAINTTTDYDDPPATVGSPCPGGGSPHPNECGYFKWYQADEAALAGSGITMFFPGLAGKSGTMPNGVLAGGPVSSVGGASTADMSNFWNVNQRAANSTLPSASNWSPGMTYWNLLSNVMTGHGFEYDSTDPAGANYTLAQWSNFTHTWWYCPSLQSFGHIPLPSDCTVNARLGTAGDYVATSIATKNELGLNRGASGAIFDSSGFGYQWHPTRSLTDSSDKYCLQVYNPNGSVHIPSTTCWYANGKFATLHNTLDDGSGNATFASARTTTYTVGTLPAASSLPAGTQVVVTDSVAYTPGVCAGGGSDYMIAVTDGSSVWSCH